jgi:lysophospholipase L1-like esterase
MSASTAGQRPEGRSGRSRNRLRGPLISLGVLVALLVLGEGAVRLGGWAGAPLDVLRLAGLPNRGEPATLWDRDLLYRLRPDTLMFNAYRINRLGYRGPDVDAIKPPDTLRIVCTGDSSTFGMGVADDETWPARLEVMLDALLDRERSVEVINAAVPGYSTEQNKRQVLRDLLALQPDVLIVCPTAQNDLRWQANAGDAAALDDNTAWRAWLDRSHLLRLVRGGALRDAFHAGGRREPGSGGARPRVTPDEFEANLRNIAEAAREQGVRTLFLVTEHSAWRESSDPAVDESEASVARAAGDVGALLADSREAFAGYAPYPMFSDGIHFTPLGQQLVAISALRALLQHPEQLVQGRRAEALVDWAASLGGGPVLGPGDIAHPGDIPGLVIEMGHDWVLPELTESSPHRHPPNPIEIWSGGVEAHAAADMETQAGWRSLEAFNRDIGALPPSIDRRVASAIDATRHGDYEASLPLFEAALAETPDNIEALFEYGMALRRLGRRDEGTEMFRRGAEADREGPIGRFLTGLLAFESGDMEIAEWALRNAISQQSTLGEARFTLGRLLLQRGELDEAEKQLRMSILMRTESDAAAALLLEIEARRADG